MTTNDCLCRPCEPCADALRAAITRARVGELDWVLENTEATCDCGSVIEARIRKIKDADDAEGAALVRVERQDASITRARLRELEGEK